MSISFITFFYKIGKKNYMGKHFFETNIPDNDGLDMEVKPCLVYWINVFRKQRGLSYLKSKYIRVGVISYCASFMPIRSSTKEIKSFDYYNTFCDHERCAYINGKRVLDEDDEEEEDISEADEDYDPEEDEEEDEEEESEEEISEADESEADESEEEISEADESEVYNESDAEREVERETLAERDAQLAKNEVLLKIRTKYINGVVKLMTKREERANAREEKLNEWEKHLDKRAKQLSSQNKKPSHIRFKD